MKDKNIKKAARIILGANLVFAGISHLTFARKDFRALVPDFVPLKKDETVLYSGFAEIALGAALILSPEKHAGKAGQIAAAFFTAVFPGNIAQFTNRRNAFGLDTDKKRFIRLFFQPVLVYWALKSTSGTHKLPGGDEIKKMLSASLQRTF
jgi:uncharacterized membrane protein